MPTSPWKHQCHTPSTITQPHKTYDVSFRSINTIPSVLPLFALQIVTEKVRLTRKNQTEMRLPFFTHYFEAKMGKGRLLEYLLRHVHTGLCSASYKLLIMIDWGLF